MRRRLLVARGLIHGPRLVLLDEPTVGLDPQVRQELWTLIDGLRASGVTVLMSTHYIEEAERLADTVAVMSHGEIVAQGPPAELVREHAGEQVLEVYGPPERLSRSASSPRAAAGRAAAAAPRSRSCAPRSSTAKRPRASAATRTSRTRSLRSPGSRSNEPAAARRRGGRPRPARGRRRSPARTRGARRRHEPRCRGVRSLLEGDDVLLRRPAAHLPARVRARLRRSSCRKSRATTTRNTSRRGSSRPRCCSPPRSRACSTRSFAGSSSAHTTRCSPRRWTSKSS